MTQYIDLHTHSTFSDGILSPAQLIKTASDKGVAALSITDHDTMAGVPEALSCAEEFGVEIIPGIELSAQHQDLSVHILGYGLDFNSLSLGRTLKKIQLARKERNIKIFKRLNGFGFSLAIDQLPETPNGQLGRPHIARLLLDQGIVKSEQEAFSRFLRDNGAAFVPRKTLPVQEALTTISEAGGVAVLAHPGSLKLPENKLALLLNELKDIGLAGMEVFHPIHSKKNIYFLQNLCNNLNLLITGGSDFHGRVRDRSPLGQYGNGRPITANLLAKLKDRINGQ